MLGIRLHALIADQYRSCATPESAALVSGPTGKERQEGQPSATYSRSHGCQCGATSASLQHRGGAASQTGQLLGAPGAPTPCCATRSFALDEAGARRSPGAARRANPTSSCTCKVVPCAEYASELADASTNLDERSRRCSSRRAAVHGGSRRVRRAKPGQQNRSVSPLHIVQKGSIPTAAHNAAR